MLELKRVSFRYGAGHPWLFRDLDLTVGEGEIVGVSGDSGRGKTTLAAIAAGYLRPTKGEIMVDGAPLAAKGYRPEQLALQHPELAFNPRWKMRKIFSEVEGFFPDDRLLADLGINPLWMGRFPHELSGGELQRIAVARFLNPQTRYLFADELTSMLDPITQAQIWNSVIDFVRKNGIGVVAISHDGELLDRICDRRAELFQSKRPPVGQSMKKGMGMNRNKSLRTPDERFDMNDR